MMTIEQLFRGDAGLGRRSKAIIPAVLVVGELKSMLNDTRKPTFVTIRSPADGQV